MNKVVLNYCMVVFVLSMVCCAPRTKDGYMKQYAEFVEEVSKSYSLYTDEVWSDVEETFNKFKSEYYNKFKNELTTNDKIKLVSYEVKYAYYKSLDATKDSFDAVTDELEVEEKVKAVKDYIEK